MLGLIFLLVLTLINAFLFRKGSHMIAEHSYAAVQLSEKRSIHYEWDAFIWREIGAIVVTIVLFGAFQVFAGSSTHERK